LLLFDKGLFRNCGGNFNRYPTIFLGIEVTLKLLFIFLLEMAEGSLWKDVTYTLQLLLGAPLTA